MPVLQKVLADAARRLATAIHAWGVASDPAAVFLLVLARLNWKVESARVIVTDIGMKVDFLLLAPKAIGFLADEATVRWSERGYDGGFNVGIAWDTYAQLRKTKEWTTREDATARKIVSLGVTSDKDLAKQGTLQETATCAGCLLEVFSTYTTNATARLRRDVRTAQTTSCKRRSVCHPSTRNRLREDSSRTRAVQVRRHAQSRMLLCFGTTSQLLAG